MPRRTWQIAAIVAALLIVVVIGIVVVRGRGGDGGAADDEGVGEGGKPASGDVLVDKRPSTDLPVNATVPVPPGQPFHGCPPEGDGGDRTLNRHKNRSDTAQWIPVTFDALEKLAWPRAAERTDYDRWPKDVRDQIDKYSGLPVAIEGYLFGARKSGPESTNCHATQYNDYHVWLTAGPGQDRTHSIVVEPTPRILERHPKWTVEALTAIAHNNERVRISGWTMFDPEHPDQVGKTRGTIWEIHPVMQIEVQRNGAWVPLDDLR